MASYTFDTNILSASQVGIGNPVAPSTSFPLTAAGIGIISLSSTHEGLAFNALPTSVLSGQSVTAAVRGSNFNINSVYHNRSMALFEIDNTYTVFTFNSATPTTQTILLSGTRDVSTPEHRRKWVLGYY
jgi:hypothetical protein